MTLKIGRAKKTVEEIERRSSRRHTDQKKRNGEYANPHRVDDTQPVAEKTNHKDWKKKQTPISGHHQTSAAKNRKPSYLAMQSKDPFRCPKKTSCFKLPPPNTKLPNVIGILDSGVGGLSVLREIHTLLPGHSLTYIGDSAWCPYGPKSYSEIQSRVFMLSDWLLAQGAEMIVVACNSATIAAIRTLRNRYDIPFIGMEPGVKPAAEITRSKTIGVLATEASLSGEKFRQLVETHAPGLKVITQPCPKFVQLVEAGTLSGPEVTDAILEYTHDMVQAGADTLILGCTHYPFLKSAIEKTIPNHIQLIDTGPAVARRVSGHHPSKDADPQIHLHTTGPMSELRRLLPLLCPTLTASCHSFPLS